MLSLWAEIAVINLFGRLSWELLSSLSQSQNPSWHPSEAQTWEMHCQAKLA